MADPSDKQEKKPARQGKKAPLDEFLSSVDADGPFSRIDLLSCRNLLESMQIATVFLDNQLRVRSFTPSASDIFRLLDTDIGTPLDHLSSRIIYPELGTDVRKVVSTAGTIERDVSSKDGRSYIARILPYQSVDNLIFGAVITFVDVTGTVRAEAALHETEGRLRTLLAELQHRVRNTLSVVKSITQRTADSSDSVKEMAAHLCGRIDAFARVQSAVTRNPEAGIELASLVADELLAHAAREGESLAIDGPGVALRPKAAESMSLAIHELATNAVKHGALVGKNGGRIAIRWELDGTGIKQARDSNGHLNFQWIEKSANGPLDKPSRHGFGMELLTRILPYDLGAKTSVEFEPSGLHFTMELPGEHLARGGRNRKKSGDAPSAPPLAEKTD